MGNDNAGPPLGGPVFNRREAADLVGSTADYLATMARDNTGPVFTRLYARGNPVVYSAADLRAWVAANRPAELADFESRLAAMIGEG